MMLLFLNNANIIQKYKLFTQDSVSGKNTMMWIYGLSFIPAVKHSVEIVGRCNKAKEPLRDMRVENREGLTHSALLFSIRQG